MSTDDSLTGGIARIVVLGLVLGFAYNAMGLRAEKVPSWGVSWIGKDRVAEMPSLDALGGGGGGGGGGYGAMDDPMGLGGGGAGLPDVPDLDRPIQMQLAAVQQFIDRDAALVIDAREPDEFAAGHIPGAISMPYDEVSSEPERLAELDAGGRPIIVYCGGGTCELSMNLAFDLLNEGQTKVLVYMGGYTEWVEVGNPVETR